MSLIIKLTTITTGSTSKFNYLDSSMRPTYLHDVLLLHIYVFE